MLTEIHYRLEFEDGHQEDFSIRLDPDSGELATAAGFEPPDWTALHHHQCSHCPLDARDVAQCPVAANMAQMFSGRELGSSHDAVRLQVSTGERTTLFHTTAQRALGSLLGLVCALSPCPHTQPLRPMAIFHLPLANEAETLFRAASMFLLQSYLDHLEDPSQPVDLELMVNTYRNLAILNRALAERLRDQKSDSAINAVVLLDILARGVKFELDDQLQLLRSYFRSPRHPYAPDQGVILQEMDVTGDRSS